jgi:hypothetical protein
VILRFIVFLLESLSAWGARSTKSYDPLQLNGALMLRSKASACKRQRARIQHAAVRQQSPQPRSETRIQLRTGRSIQQDQR